MPFPQRLTPFDTDYLGGLRWRLTPFDTDYRVAVPSRSGFRSHLLNFLQKRLSEHNFINSFRTGRIC